jgi:4-amino-4-deoxy-L-arabinose transferase-like glycosyltransferase
VNSQKFYKIKTLYIPLFLSFLLGLINIQKLDFWRDEAFTVNAAKRPFLDIINIAINDVHPPLHIFITKIFGMLFGFNEISLRLPSLIFQLINIFFVWKISQLIFKKDFLKKWGYLPTWLICLSPNLFYYSIETRSYSLLTALCSVGIYFLIKIQQEKKIKILDYLGLSLTAIFLLYTHTLGVVVVFSLFTVGIVNLCLKSKVKNYKELWKINKWLFLSGSVAFISYLPWLNVVLDQANKISDQGFWLTFSPVQDIFTNLNWIFSSQGSTPEINYLEFGFRLFPLLIIPLFLFGFISQIEKKKLFLPSLYVIQMGLIFFLSYRSAIYYFRYFLFILPIMSFIIAYSFEELEKNFKLITLRFLSLILLLSSFLTSYSLLQDSNSRANYKQIISDLRFQNLENSLILHSDAFTFHSFYHYSQGNNPQSLVYNLDGPLAYYQGTSVLQQKDYLSSYDFDLADKKMIYLIYLYKNEKVIKLLEDKNFKFEKEKNYSGGVIMETWSK